MWCIFFKKSLFYLSYWIQTLAENDASDSESTESDVKSLPPSTTVASLKKVHLAKKTPTKSPAKNKQSTASASRSKHVGQQTRFNLEDIGNESSEDSDDNLASEVSGSSFGRSMSKICAERDKRVCQNQLEARAKKLKATRESLPPHSDQELNLIDKRILLY